MAWRSAHWEFSATWLSVLHSIHSKSLQDLLRTQQWTNTMSIWRTLWWCPELIVKTKAAYSSTSDLAGIALFLPIEGLLLSMGLVMWLSRTASNGSLSCPIHLSLWIPESNHWRICQLPGRLIGWWSLSSADSPATFFFQHETVAEAKEVLTRNSPAESTESPSVLL